MHDLKIISTSSLVNGIEKEFEQVETLIKKLPKINDDNWQDVLNSVRIFSSKVYEAPPMCIEVCKGDHSFRWGTLGNISTIIGKAKSRKSFLISIIICALLFDGFNSTLKITLKENNKRILFFDTEQSQYDVHLMLKRIEKATGKEIPDWIEVYGLRCFKPNDRRLLVFKKIEDTQDSSLVFIDGVRDLSNDPILDADQANEIITELMRLSEQKMIHIVSVLHQNRGNDHAVGHIGRETINKSESVILVETKDNVTEVRAEFTRGRPFESFAFTVNDEGIPALLDGYVSVVKNEIKKPSKKPSEPHGYSKDFHNEILSKIFSVSEQFSRIGFEKELRSVLKPNEIDTTTDNLCNWIRYYKSNGYVNTKGNGGRGGIQFSRKPDEENK